MAVLEIHKKGNKNFLHIYNGNEIIASETDIKIVDDIVKITFPNSSPLFLKEGFLYTNVKVYDENGTNIPFNTKEELNQVLIGLNYIAFGDIIDTVDGGNANSF